jgi:AraC-like DNA-binding protein
MRDEVARLHDALACTDDALDAETRLHVIVDRIRRSFGDTAPGESATNEAAEALRAYLDTHLFEPVTLTAAASELAASPTQVARAFTETFGITPHAYVIGRRLDAARTRILDGQPLADVASEVGFYDQAHLTRRFKRFLGTTPGQFGHGVRSRPDRVPAG